MNSTIVSAGNNSVWYIGILSNMTAEDVRYEDLNEDTKAYFRFTLSTILYLSVCLTCNIWQLYVAIELAYKRRKLLYYAIVFETCLSFLTIMCSVLNPLTDLDCNLRYWVSIVVVELGGCCIQSILMYKAYICNNRSIPLLIIGSFINAGYIALIIAFALLARVPTYKDILGNCVMENLEWPALAKLAIDITSNLFLSLAFIMVIRRHYAVFGNNMYKSLISRGVIFCIGVILSNLICAILVSCRAVGGLSADLYSFDWIITSYLLIKQSTANETSKGQQPKAQAFIDKDKSAIRSHPNDPSAKKNSRRDSSASFDITSMSPITKGPTTTKAYEEHSMRNFEYSKNRCTQESMDASTLQEDTTKHRASSDITTSVADITTVAERYCYHQSSDSFDNKKGGQKQDWLSYLESQQE